MPRFPVAFGRRKSTADNLENVSIAQPSFRVLDRSQVGAQNSFDGGARLAARAHTYSKASLSDIVVEDNLFADLKTNRYVYSDLTLSHSKIYFHIYHLERLRDVLAGRCRRSVLVWAARLASGHRHDLTRSVYTHTGEDFGFANGKQWQRLL